MQYSANVDGSASQRIDADLLTAVLNIRLTAIIREKLGASYSPTAGVSIVDGPTTEAVVNFHVSGAPDNMALIAQVLQDDLAGLRSSGPTAAEMSAAIAEVKDQYGLISNQEIIEAIVRSLAEPQAIVNYANAYVDVDKVSADQLRKFARLVLPEGQYIQVTQLPR